MWLCTGCHAPKCCEPERGAQGRCDNCGAKGYVVECIRKAGAYWRCEFCLRWLARHRGTRWPIAWKCPRCGHVSCEAHAETYHTCK